MVLLPMGARASPYWTYRCQQCKGRCWGPRGMGCGGQGWALAAGACGPRVQLLQADPCRHSHPIAMRRDPLRCFPKWALSTHFTDKENEAQGGEETAACNFSAASQLLSKMGDEGKLGWLTEGDQDNTLPWNERTHTHTHTHRCATGTHTHTQMCHHWQESRPRNSHASFRG